MKIIGLTGKKGSGKTTIAKELVQRGYTLKSFATPLKEAASALLGFDVHRVEDKEAVIEPYEVSLREFLQKLGTEFARDMIHKEFWIMRMEHELRGCSDDEFVVIDDVRFNNEAQMITGLGGFVVEVQREGTYNIDIHVSEAGVSPHLVDFRIENNGVNGVGSIVDTIFERVQKYAYEVDGRS